jgi:4'-phosphopantetheinyl transferase
MRTDETTCWRSPAGHAALSEHEIHVWGSPLDVAPAVRQAFAAFLSEEERTRATRFRFELHRNRFVVGRGLLRAILGRCLHVAPAGVEFTYGPQGKPHLSRRFGPSGIHFNLAHSEGLALLAVTTSGPVGIDVEKIRTIGWAGELANRCFSPHEREMFAEYAPRDRERAFFDLWTRKEAVLKATGAGIAQSLHQIEISPRSRDVALVLAVSGDADRAESWSLHDLVPAPEYAAAVAIRASGVSLRCWWLDEHLLAGLASPSRTTARPPLTAPLSDAC